MSTHRVLVFDDDRAFLELLEESLGPCGCSIQVVPPPGEALEDLLSEPPVLIFIAVDLPDKEGFILFTRVRGLAKRAPIALVTSTLSATEMSLHGKLRLHANLYLSKRSLTPEGLLQVLTPLLVGGPLGEAAGRVPMPSFRDGTGRIPEWLVDAAEEAAVHALPDWFQESAAPRDGPVTDSEAAGWIAQLEAERDWLRTALDEARRDAGSSPFSSEILSLREELSQAKAKVAHLELEVSHRDGELSRAQKTLPGLERQLGEAVRENQEALARAMLAEEQVGEGKRVLQQFEDEKQALSQAAEQDLADQRERAAESLLGAEAELRELRERFAQQEAEAEHDRRAHAKEISKLNADKASLAALEKRASQQRRRAEEEHARALAAAREMAESEKRALVKARGQLEQVERAHAEAVAALQSEHAEELQRAHDAELSATRSEWEVTLQRAVESARAEGATRMEDAQRRYEEALATLQSQHAEEKCALEGACNEALARQHEAEARASEAECVFEARLGEAEHAQSEATKAQRESDEEQPTLASLEAELQEREETITSLRCLIDDLQRTAGADTA